VNAMGQRAHGDLASKCEKGRLPEAWHANSMPPDIDTVEKPGGEEDTPPVSVPMRLDSKKISEVPCEKLPQPRKPQLDSGLQVNDSEQEFMTEFDSDSRKSASDMEPEIIGIRSRHPTYIDWKGQDDPENPRNWKLPRKVVVVGITSMIAFFSSVTSSICTPGIVDVMQEFNSTSNTLGTVCVSIFILVNCFHIQADGRDMQRDHCFGHPYQNCMDARSF
jgi:hypothetical protein